MAADSDTTLWQPIETVPKDGRRVLLAKYVRATNVHTGEPYWRNVWITEDGWNADEDQWSDDGGESQPTHWQPLPEPPHD